MHISNVSREQILHFGVNRQKYQAVAPGKTVTLGTRNTEQAAYGQLAGHVGRPAALAATVSGYRTKTLHTCAG